MINITVFVPPVCGEQTTEHVQYLRFEIGAVLWADQRK